MKAERVEKISIKMILNKEEAEWLKSQMQNLIDCSVDSEDLDSKKMRKRFFDSLI